METLIQQATRLNEQRYQQEQGKLGAFAGRVVSVTPSADELGMSFGPAPERAMPVQHPFVSQNAWIRSMPEVGTLYLMQNRFDTGQPEPIKTIPAFSRDKADSYQSGSNVYRPIQPGEHDIASNGYAFAYFSRRGNLDLRSGASVKIQLNREGQELTEQAPTIRRNLLFQSPGQLGDEERFGIVKRWTDAATEFYVKDANDNFVTEHFTHLLNPAKEGPVVLLQHIEGQVYDELGNEIKHLTTALPLRSQSQWYTTTDEFLNEQIDQNGNLLYDFPTTATTGFEIQIPNGSYRKVIGQDRDVTIDQNEKVVVKKDISYTVGQNVTYSVTKNVEIDAGQNTLVMDTASGSESVTLRNPKGFGIQATNAGGGALNLTGPQSTGLGIASSGATTLTAKQTLTITVDQTATMSGQTLNANFQFINLGKGASIPAVMGMALQTYLDQHMHTGNLGAPTSPPLVPSASFNGTPQSILSLRIMLASNS